LFALQEVGVVLVREAFALAPVIAAHIDRVTR
jgi:hypothetical protein